MEGKTSTKTIESLPLTQLLTGSVVDNDGVDKIKEQESNISLRVETLNNTLLEFTRRSQQSYLDMKAVYEGGLEKLKIVSNDLLSIFSRIRKMRTDLSKAFPGSCTRATDDIIDK